jgi:hypothetical protein
MTVIAPTDEAFRRIDALLQVGLRLARSAPSGRLLLARIADTIEPAWLPGPWVETIGAELRAARAEPLPAVEFKRVEALLREAWGTRPSDELDELERQPAAITATSQVHRGRLEGREVAVKVLRPGLAAGVRQDLALVEGLLAPLGAAFPALDPGAILGEFRDRVLDEFDLESEATAQRRFHRALRNHPFLTVPAPVMRLAHPGVLVSEWIDGVPLAEAADPDQACARLVAFVVGAARSGVVHADPDPRDVLVRPDGSLAILDFGATATVDADRVDLHAAGLEAFAAGDEAALGRALAALGWLPADRAGAALRLGHDLLGDLAGPDPVRLDSSAVIAVRDRADQDPAAVVEILLAGSLPPEDLWPARGLGQLFATIARVGATGAWRELVRAALRDGWNQSGSNTSSSQPASRR